MISLNPHDKFGNKQPQASSPAVSDLLPVCLSGSMKIEDSAFTVQKSINWTIAHFSGQKRLQWTFNSNCKL